MKAEHTPGPWEIEYADPIRQPDVLPSIRATEFRGEVACGVFHEADARLIAAAPDLLAALEAVVSTYRTFRNVPKSDQEWTLIDDEVIAAGFAAIAKARHEA